MIILFTGDHLRHKYFVDSFSKVFEDLVWIIEKREKFIPDMDKNFNTEIQKLQKKHFEKRIEKSCKYNYRSFTTVINISKRNECLPFSTTSASATGSMTAPIGEFAWPWFRKSYSYCS